MRVSLITILIYCLGLFVQAEAALYITEFVAANATGVQDEDGEYSDWIEIYNSGPSQIDLDGYFLSDDASDLTKWRFPSLLVPADWYIIVYASNKDPGVNEIHTNFKLSSGGEYLALVDPDGSTIVQEFSPTFPSLNDDESYGLSYTTGGNLVLPIEERAFSTPTPIGPNDATVAVPPVFSPDSTLFSGSVSVSLSSPQAGATIRYTTNGNDPTGSSTLYSSAITVNSRTTLKARAFVSGLADSEVVTKYFIELDAGVTNFTSDLPLVVIDSFDQSFSSTTRRYGFSTVIPLDNSGRSSLFGESDYAGNAGFTIRGSSSSNFSKKQYKMVLSDAEQNQISDNLLGLGRESDWILYAPGRYDRNMIANNFVYTLGKDMNQVYIGTEFVELYLNDDNAMVEASDYDGIYVLMESIKIDDERVPIDSLTAADNAAPEVTGGYIVSIDRGDDNQLQWRSDRDFPQTSSHFFNVVDPKLDEMTASQMAYITNHLQAAEDALFSASFENPLAGYEAYFDVESIIDNHLVHVLTFNPDGLRLSQYFTKPRGEKISATPLWDFDRTMDSDDSRDNDPEALTASGSTDLWNYDWWGQFFTGAEFNIRYIDRYYEWRETVFSTNHLFSIIDDLEGQITEAYPREDARWGSDPDYGSRYTDLSGEIDHLKDWLNTRLNFFDGHFDAPPLLAPLGGVVTSGTSVAISSPLSGTIYYTLDDSDPRDTGGAIASSALAYSGSITITNNTRVRARRKDGATWSAVNEEVYTVTGLEPQLRFTEVMYNPANPTGSEIAAGYTDNDDFEYVELRNVGLSPAELTGVTFSRGVDTTLTNGVLAVGAFGVVVKNVAAFEARYGNGLTILGTFNSGTLDNGGERITLEDNYGVELDDLSFGDTIPWPVGADGEGRSIVPTNQNPVVAANDAVDWRASASSGGSPGVLDPDPPFQTIYVNEVLAHTDLPQRDTVEIYNAGSIAQDLSYWLLTDNPSVPYKYEIPFGTLIQPGEYLVFDEDNFGSNFSLSSLGESIYLFSGDSSGGLTGYHHGFDFGASENGVSFGRYISTSGIEHFVAQESISMPVTSDGTNLLVGALNSGPVIGPAVISDIGYDLPGSFSDFVCIENISTNDFELYDVAAPNNTWGINGFGFNFPTNITLLESEQIYVINGDEVTFRDRLGLSPYVRVFAGAAGKLEGNGEKVTLQRPDSPEPDGLGGFYAPMIDVDAVRYDNKAPWPLTNTTFYLKKISNETFGNDPIAWQAVVLNTAPYMSVDPITHTMNVGDTLNTNVSAYVLDAEDATGVTFARHSGPSWLSVATNGVVTGTPASGDAGFNPIVLTLTDLGGAVGYATMEITVGSVSGNFSQEIGGNNLVVIEAEHYHNLVTAPGGAYWTLVSSGTYSGGEGMQVLPLGTSRVDSGFVGTTARMDFTIDFVTTGTHYVWLRAYASSGSENSAHAGLNATFVSSADRIENTSGSVIWTKTTRDSGSDATINIASAGEHDLNIWMREAGFVLDKIVLTTSSSYTPTGSGPAESLSVTSNRAPVAVNDTETLLEGSAVVLDVLANDYDLDSDTIFISALTTPSSGSAAITNNNQVLYQSAGGFAGVATFDYTLSDSNLTDTGSVSITVLEQNEDPVVVGPSSISLHEGAVFSHQFGSSDTNQPLQSMSFSLEGEVPSYVAIDPNTGVLSMDLSVAPTGTVDLVVRVQDSGLPPGISRQSLSLVVESEIAQFIQQASTNQYVLQWNAISGETYELQYKDHPTNAWLFLENVQPSGSEGQVTNALPSAVPYRLFRIKHEYLAP